MRYCALTKRSSYLTFIHFLLIFSLFSIPYKELQTGQNDVYQDPMDLHPDQYYYLFHPYRKDMPQKKY